MSNIPKLIEFKQKINVLIDNQIQDYRLRAADSDHIIDRDREALISLMISYYDRVSMIHSSQVSDDDTDTDYDEVDLDPNLIDEDLIRYDASDTSDSDSNLDELFDGRVYRNRDYSNDYYPIDDQQEINRRVLGLDTSTAIDEFVDDDVDTPVLGLSMQPQFPIFSNDSSADPPAYSTRDDELSVYGSSSSSENADCDLKERIAQLGDTYIVNNEKNTVIDYVSNLNRVPATEDDCIPIVDHKMPANCDHIICNTSPNIQIDDSPKQESSEALVLPDIPVSSWLSSPPDTTASVPITDLSVSSEILTSPDPKTSILSVPVSSEVLTSPDNTSILASDTI